MTSVRFRLAFLMLGLHGLVSLPAAELRDTMPDTRVATDALGRTLPMSVEVGLPRPDRTVDIFYFTICAS